MASTPDIGTAALCSARGAERRIAMPGLGLKRSVFLVDRDGILRWKHVARLGLTFQPVQTLTAQIAALG